MINKLLRNLINIKNKESFINNTIIKIKSKKKHNKLVKKIIFI